jgi:hypothetical protein
VTRVPYPFRSQIAKVELEEVFSEVRRKIIANSSRIHRPFLLCRVRESEERRSPIGTLSERQGRQRLKYGFTHGH